jgi:NAD(P) transhydrogenase subunit beta
VIVGVMIVLNPSAVYLYWILVAIASVLGVMFVLPVGGADMPVVICLLNSYSGMAGCATGFVINNNALIIAGALVGSSGIILSDIMCRAMNRSLFNVLLGVLGPTEGTPTADAIYAGKIKSVTAEEVSMLFDAARRVVFVPGYGLAVSQAHHVVKDLANMLEAKGIEVDYAIHPVAGRMPGHMNVLLAEAGVPYDRIFDLEEINAEFATADTALVIGANDLVNPAARDDKASPLWGMPILDVDKARNVLVIKRGKGAGFAGVDNRLFYGDTTRMLYGDGQEMAAKLVQGVRSI